MREESKSMGGGFVPGRLIITLTDTALEQLTDTTTRARQQKRPAEIKGFGVQPLDRLLEQHGVRSIQPATRQRRFEHLVQVRLNRRFILEFPEDTDLEAIMRPCRSCPKSKG